MSVSAAAISHGLAATAQQGFSALATAAGDARTMHDEIKPPALLDAFEDVPDKIAKGY